MNEPLAIFDLEGTLSTKSGSIVWRELLVRRFHRQFGSRKVLWHLPYALFINVLYRVRIISKRKAYIIGSQETAVLLRGVSQANVNEFAEAVALKITSRVRPEICEILQEHKRQGLKIVILSGVFQPILNLVAAKLGIEIRIGTKLEQKKGRYTGHLSGSLCFDEEKLAMLKEYIKEKALEIDFKRSFAYADSFTDRYVLELVGNPVATYPDDALRKYAHEKGWKIIG